MTYVDQNRLHKVWGRMRTQSPFVQSSPKAFGDHRKGSDIYTRSWRLAAGEVPVVSGASMRGWLRRVLVGDMLERIGQPAQSLPVRTVHLLMVGGALNPAKKNGDGGKEDVDEMSPAKLLQAREVVPSFALLGGTLWGGFAAGRLRAGFWVGQNSATPESAKHGMDPDAELLKPEECFMTERYAKHDELRGLFTLAELEKGFGVAEIPGITAAGNAKAEDDEDRLGALYGYRAVVPDMPFAGWFALGHYMGLSDEADALQRSCLRHGLELAFPDGEEITFGLGAAAGYGDVVFEWENLDAMLPSGDLYRKYLEDHGQVVRDALKALDTKAQPTPPKSSKKAKGEPAEGDAHPGSDE